MKLSQSNQGRILAREKIDAVVLDLRLLDFEDLQLMDEMRSRQRYLPIIINAGYDQVRNAFHCCGAEAFVVKASALAELKDAVVQVIPAAKA